MKRKMMFLPILPFCLALLLVLSSCVDDQGKETTPPSDDPPSVEIDVSGDATDGELIDDGIVVTLKDSDMDIEVTPKNPGEDVVVIPKE